MPEGFGWRLVWTLIGVTVYWAAIWYWLPAMFRDREREPPESGPKAKDADDSRL